MWMNFSIEVHEENGRNSYEGRKEIQERIIMPPFSSYILLLILMLTNRFNL